MFDVIVTVAVLSAAAVLSIVYMSRAIERATRLGYQMGQREDVGLPDVRETPREFDMIDRREQRAKIEEDEDLEDVEEVV